MSNFFQIITKHKIYTIKLSSVTSIIKQSNQGKSLTFFIHFGTEYALQFSYPGAIGVEIGERIHDDLLAAWMRADAQI